MHWQTVLKGMIMQGASACIYAIVYSVPINETLPPQGSGGGPQLAGVTDSVFSSIIQRDPTL